MTIPGLPVGYSVRRPTLADGEAILAVVPGTAPAPGSVRPAAGSQLTKVVGSATWVSCRPRGAVEPHGICSSTCWLCTLQTADAGQGSRSTPRTSLEHCDCTSPPACVRGGGRIGYSANSEADRRRSSAAQTVDSSASSIVTGHVSGCAAATIRSANEVGQISAEVARIPAWSHHR
jgi:hypothetical protein